MRFVSFAPTGDSASRPGVLRGGRVTDLGSIDPVEAEPDRSSLGRLLEAHTEGILDGETAGADTPEYDRAEVDLHAPVAGDARLLCLGGAYPSHLRARGQELDSVPSVWSAPDTSIVGPDEPIVLPDRVSEHVVPAVELGVVIGIGGAHIGQTRAYDHVAGYTIVNDVTARTDWPGPMAYKLLDTFSPCGPAIHPADRIEDPHRLDMSIRIDGEAVCEGSTAGIRFSIPFVVSYLSTIFELRPGDVIATGDPAGVEGRLRDGARVDTEIETVGTLSNPVVEGSEAP